MKDNFDSTGNDIPKTALELPNFSNITSIDVAFNTLYSFLKKQWNVIELDLFLIDDNALIDNARVDGITPSVSLENTYQDLEERGILEWVATANEIKAIPNIDDNLKQINSIIIVPITLLENIVAFFIANSPLSPNEINDSAATHIKFVANYTFTLISMLKINSDKNKILSEYTQLKKQTIVASNQIAASEVFVAMNESFDSPLKIIKANLEFIQKDVGDTKHRIKILVEQFHAFINAQKFMQELSSELECSASVHSIGKIIEHAIEIANPFLTKNDIVIDYKHDKDIDKLKVNGFKIQLVFAIFNTIRYSISTIPDGGTIDLRVDWNNENNNISVVIIDNGTGINNANNDGNLVYAVDVSPQKMQMQFLFNLSQNVITKHQGKFSTFCQEGKGTTYKITLPCTTT